MTLEEARRISPRKHRTEASLLETASVNEFGVPDRSSSPFDGTTPRSPEPGERFSAEIDRQLERSDSRDVSIAVHGYGVTAATPSPSPSWGRLLRSG